MSIMVGKYLGGEVVVGSGGGINKFAAGIPEGTNVIWIMARGGAVYATLNGEASANTSPVYVPEDAVRLLGPFNNIHSLGIYLAASVYAHIVYEKSPLPE